MAGKGMAQQWDAVGNKADAYVLAGTPAYEQHTPVCRSKRVTHQWTDTRCSCAISLPLAIARKTCYTAATSNFFTSTQRDGKVMSTPSNYRRLPQIGKSNLKTRRKATGEIQRTRSFNCLLFPIRFICRFWRCWVSSRFSACAVKNCPFLTLRGESH